MKYLLLVYMREEAMTAAEHEQCGRDATGMLNELRASGSVIGANPLQPVATATSLRVREGRRLVTDGPFAETREQLGGYILIDVENLDQAIDIAARLPPAKRGTVEIRPVRELPEASAPIQEAHQSGAGACR